ncbi:unnamed protein product [Orchesella dallaii]|uniref:Uncharacterized protein n=1 Tax=Orchesella dallaii TaxID=48710 RepID=A0ABP1Q326_9HEXA
MEFKPFGSEKEIEQYLLDITFNITAFQQFKGALVFETGLDLGSSSRSGTISYKIRLVALNAVSKTNTLFPPLQEPGPSHGIARLYPRSGFSYLQLCIDRVLAKRLTGTTFSHNEFLCDAKSFFLDPKLRDCCANCAQLHVPCFKPISYLSWDYKRELPDRDNPFSDPTILELPGIGQEFVYMIIMALVYLTMLMMLEYRIFQRIFAAICKSKLAVFKDNVRDEDVMAEVNRVTDMVKSGELP